MTPETLPLLIVIGALLVLVMGLAAISGFAWWRANERLMWFHRAGGSMAEYELQKARIDLEGKKAEVDQKRADAELIRAQNSEETPRGVNGGRPQRITERMAG